VVARVWTTPHHCPLYQSPLSHCESYLLHIHFSIIMSLFS